MTIAGLLYLALFALAAGMPRHAPMLLGPWHRPGSIAAMPRIGWGLLAASLLAAILVPDGGRTIVYWFALLPLAGGLVLLALTFGPVLARVLACAASVAVVAGILF